MAIDYEKLTTSFFLTTILNEEHVIKYIPSDFNSKQNDNYKLEELQTQLQIGIFTKIIFFNFCIFFF